MNILVPNYAWAQDPLKPEIKQKIEGISLEVVDNEEAAKLLSENQESQPEGHINLISSTDSISSTNIQNMSTDQIARNPSKRVYLNFPFDRVKKNVSTRASYVSKHAYDQYDYYSKDKAAVFVLTVLAANTSLSWFIFSPDVSVDTSAVIVGINTFLYAYIGVNASNWSRVIRGSKSLLTKSARFNRLGPKLQDFVTTLTTGAAYNLAYNGLIQSIVHWNDFDSLFSFNVIGLILKNTAITLSVSSVWDFALNELEDKGRISQRLRRKLSWTRSIFMVVMINMISIGVPNSYYGIIAYGALGLGLGLEAYFEESTKEQLNKNLERLKKLRPRLNTIKKVKDTFKLGRRNSENESHSNANVCKIILNN